ncbi:hypothetical protein SALBM135S_02420 [Streptomyces alboniger]
MMSDLKIPYTAFLSDYLVKKDYGYFKKMQGRGVTLNNHTLNHRYLPGLSYEAQRHEICGMQDTIEKRYGKRPELFRPPYGNYNRDTLRAARSCGIKAVPLWASEAFADRMEWREWDRDLHPGDIILSHFRGREDWKGTMPDMVREVMKTVTDKGYRSPGCRTTCDPPGAGAPPPPDRSPPGHRTPRPRSSPAARNRWTRSNAWAGKAAEKVPSRLTEESGKPGAVHRCGQSFRTAERVGAAPTAGR